MRMGIMGTRGIPNRYGGFEQFAEEFSFRMVEKGHEVTVYNSSLHPFQENEWNGVRVVHCKDPENRLGTFGQFIYDLNCLKDASQRNFDLLLMLGYTSSSVWMRFKPKDCITISNMDGLEWKRQKYSGPVRTFLKRAEKWAALKSDFLIADSPAIQHYLKEKYGKESFYVAYGANLFHNPNPMLLKDFGVKKEAYSLLIARPEPENNIATICEGYRQSGQTEPLLIVGNFSNAFGRHMVKKYAAENIRFLGPIYKPDLINNLRFHSRLYFHGHSVGGTNPSLLEAMAASALICAHNNEFNRSVLHENAFYFHTAGDIKNLLENLPDKRNHSTLIESNLDRIRTEYSWEHICNQLEEFFNRCLHQTA